MEYPRLWSFVGKSYLGQEFPRNGRCLKNKGGMKERTMASESDFFDVKPVLVAVRITGESSEIPNKYVLGVVRKSKGVFREYEEAGRRGNELVGNVYWVDYGTLGNRSSEQGHLSVLEEDIVVLLNLAEEDAALTADEILQKHLPEIVVRLAFVAR